MILCLGLTPALQRTMIFGSMHLNDVNRVKQVVISAAGKPINTARAMAVLGAECKVAGFNGGHNGGLVNGFLAEYGITSALTSMSSETRICSTLIDESSGAVTELVEEAPRPSPQEIDAFIKDNITLLPECDLLVMCGTLPPFAPNNFYCNFSRAAAELNIPVVIDSHKSALLAVLPELERA
jgi:fructose-1-phosphate kinase PfkB-like protein